MPPEPDEPTIRPLPSEADEPRPSPGRHAWLTIAAAAVALVVGLLIGFDIGSDPEVPDTLAGTLASQPPDLAGPGFVEPASTASTSPPSSTTTTTTTTRAEPEPPPTLGEMVPGLDGTMLLAFLGENGEVARWRIDDPWPERFALPAFTHAAGFDAAADWVAALGASAAPLRQGETLWLAGRDFQFQPFESGVTSFVWHPATPGRLAWTRTTLDGAVELWSGGFPGPTEEIRLVASFEDTGVGLAAWGDWGYALLAAGAEVAPRLITLGPEGEVLTEESGTELWGASAGGTLVVARYAAAPVPTVWLVGPSLAGGEQVDWLVGPPAQWSADGARAASVTIAGVGAVLQISGEGSFQSVLDTQFAIPVAWTPDDRFVVAWASGVRTRFSARPGEPLSAREGRRPALVFTDLADRSTSAIAIDGPVGAIAFRVAG